MPRPSGILFTAFEPSGDMVAAQVISRLIRSCPGIRIWALGGPKMETAGATLIESTTDRPVMGAAALSQAWAHHQRLNRVHAWLKAHPIDAFVPTDSPAANWSICAAVRRHQPRTKIVHLVAPQLWAWAQWRVRRLQRLTDHVLCLFPFESSWFGTRGVEATFVGHPVFNRSNTSDSEHVSDLNDGDPALALLPGSRQSEVMNNWPTMLDIFLNLKDKHPGLQAVVAAAHEDAGRIIRQITDQKLGAGVWPDRLRMMTDQADAVLRWANLALVVSGTATLQVASHFRPMVVIFNTTQWRWQIVRWLLNTRTFALPNLIDHACLKGKGLIASSTSAGEPLEHSVPEFVPHFGAVEPIQAELELLIDDPVHRDTQVQVLRCIGDLFAELDFADTAATQLMAVIDRASP